MKKLNAQEWLEHLQAHREWVKSIGESGKRLELIDADLSGLDLSGENLQEAILPGAKFDGCRLIRTDFYGTVLASATFTGADLSGVDFTKANLDYSVLAGCTLRNANGLRASFYEADLRGANLTGAGLFKAFLYGANLEGAILRGAYLERACLNCCTLIGADLQGAQALNAVSIREWIEVGTPENPVKLEGEEALTWLMGQIGM